jgi:hypothetical protein
VTEAEQAPFVAGLSYGVAPPVDSQPAWDDLNAWLPAMVEELVLSTPYGPDNLPPSDGRGVYLFSRADEHLYVGRTGITARTREASKDPTTSFYARWRQHTHEKSPPNSAPFANKLAKEGAIRSGFELPSDLKKTYKLQRAADWWTRLRHLNPPPDYYVVFQDAKRFIREELEFRCVRFDDDVRGVRLHVAEVYVDVILQTKYGDFSPS